MTILLNNMNHLPTILQSWGINGARIVPSGDIVVGTFDGGLTLTSDGGIQLKKGDNTIKLASLSLVQCAVFVEPSAELRAAAASILAQSLYISKENEIIMNVLCTKDVNVKSLATLSLLKGAFR